MRTWGDLVRAVDGQDAPWRHELDGNFLRALEEKLFALIEAQLEFLAPYEKFIGAAFVHALRPTSKIAFSMQALDLRNRYIAFVQELLQESRSVPSGSVLTWAAPSVFWIYYVGILLYWLNDRSEGNEATWAFLDRRIDDVMRFEKWKADVSSWTGSRRFSTRR